MANEEYPQVNGQMVGWAEIAVSIEIADGEKIQTRDIAAIDWSDKLEGAKVPGTGPSPVGRTTGAYDASGSMTMYRASYRRFMDALAQINSRVGLAVFDVIVSWSPLDEDGGTAEDTYTTKLIGCRVQERQSSNAPGGDASQIVMPLSVLRVEEDGRCLV